jgi:hypothetical protein
VKDAQGKPLKDWTVPPGDAKPLAPGAAVPLKLEFGSPPEGGTTVELKVVK